MTTPALGEGDFRDCIEALGGCPHLPPGTPQSLDTICTPCRESVTALVLLREAYERDPSFYDGKRK